MSHPTLRFTLNGEPVECAVDPRVTLRDLLHGQLDRAEVKQGCAEGVCGACVVLVDGSPRASCLILGIQAEGRQITTVTGLLALGGEMAAAHRAFCEQAVARESFQCGYCAPGFVVSATHLIATRRETDPLAVRQALAGHLCRCTGYQQIVEAVSAAAAGEPPPPCRPRVDLREKLDGAARYPTDLGFEDQLIGKVLWSEHAAARVRAIDVEDALGVEGVEVILTHHDIPGRNLGADTLFAEDQPLLAEGRVRSRGDAVALVAARSEAAALEALRRIRVTYEPEPAVLDVLEAIAPGAPHLGGHDNVVAQFVQSHGDVERGFGASDIVVEGTYASEINDHTCMEPECGVARWDDGTLELTVTTLTPHVVRAGVARALGLPEERVRMCTPRMGGSFGKYLVPGVELFLALLAYRARRPVRLVLDRQEIIGRRAKRHPFWGRYKLGMKRDGTFVALEADVIADAGPYVSITPTVVSVFADEAAGAYVFPSVWARTRGVLTNNLLSAPMRGFGSQQINFGIESIVEKAARVSGIDPVALRAKNLSRTRLDGRGDEVEAPEPVLAETLTRVVDAMGPRPAPPEGWRAGRGLTTVKCKYGFPYGLVDRFVAKVGLDEEGGFFVESDVPDSGTGILAGAARIVAAQLDLAEVPRSRLSRTILADPSGVDFHGGRPPSPLAAWGYRFLEKLQAIQAAASMMIVVRTRPSFEVRLLHALAWPINWLNAGVNWIKSRCFPYSIDSFLPRTSSSRGMFMVGLAAVDAAERFREAALGAASRRLGVPVGALAWRPQGVRHAGPPERIIPWKELGRMDGGPLVGLGRAEVPKGLLIDPRTGNQLGAVDHMYASLGVDLAVHPGTGEVKILRIVACQDVGKLFDPEVVRGQVIGAITMGLGQALWEKIFVERGAVANASMHDYLIASMLDAPPDPTIEILESGEGRGPLGAKGVGEAGAVAAPIAVVHALYDALGVQVARIPVTPEDLVELVPPTKED